MAAAFHGDLDTIRHLLSLGAKASLTDAGGKSAAMFAGMRGHRECFAELQRVADEEEKEERARKTKRRGSAGGGGEGAAGDDGLDYVYDLYYFEPSASISPTEGAPASGGGEATGAPTSSGKIGERVSLSASRHVPRLLRGSKRVCVWPFYFCWQPQSGVERSFCEAILSQPGSKHLSRVSTTTHATCEKGDTPSTGDRASKPFCLHRWLLRIQLCFDSFIFFFFLLCTRCVYIVYVPAGV